MSTSDNKCGMSLSKNKVEISAKQAATTVAEVFDSGANSITQNAGVININGMDEIMLKSSGVITLQAGAASMTLSSTGIKLTIGASSISMTPTDITIATVQSAINNDMKMTIQAPVSLTIESIQVKIE